MRNVLGYASFLIVLRTQRISRSLSLIPQRIPASLAVVSAAAGPAPHSHPARVCSVLHPPSHAGQGILWESLAVGRGVASARSTDAGRRRRPARWTRLSASNRLRSRSSPRTKIAVGRRRATAGGPPRAQAILLILACEKSCSPNTFELEKSRVELEIRFFNLYDKSPDT